MLDASSFILYSLSNSIDILNNSASMDASLGHILASDQVGGEIPSEQPSDPSPDNNTPVSNPDDDENNTELKDETTLALPHARQGTNPPAAESPSAGEIDNNDTAPAQGVQPAQEAPNNHSRGCNCNNCNEDQALRER
jgi:hypothetical protein